MIELVDVDKRYNGNVVFNKFNLKIEDNEFIMITGASGIGKSTLLNIIGCLETINDGKIIIDGKIIKKKKEKIDVIQNKMGFLFQNFALIENKTVLDNLNVIYKKSRTDFSIDDVLDKVGLLDKKNSLVFTLSGGEQQRIAIARLLLKKCKYVLADEPTGSLDNANEINIMKLLKMLHKNGKTIIMVTHNENLMEYATKCIDLNKK